MQDGSFCRPTVLFTNALGLRKLTNPLVFQYKPNPEVQTSSPAAVKRRQTIPSIGSSFRPQLISPDLSLHFPYVDHGRGRKPPPIQLRKPLVRPNVH